MDHLNKLNKTECSYGDILAWTNENVYLYCTTMCNSWGWLKIQDQLMTCLSSVNFHGSSSLIVKPDSIQCFSMKNQLYMYTYMGFKHYIALDAYTHIQRFYHLGFGIVSLLNDFPQQELHQPPYKLFPDPKWGYSVIAQFAYPLLW